jgi:hypothetical protein
MPVFVIDFFFFLVALEFELFVFLMTANLIRVRWNLSAVLIYISFMAKDGEHFSMYLPTICICS